MYAISTGKKKIVKFYDSSSDEEDLKKKERRKPKKDKKCKKKTSGGCSTLLYPSGPVPVRFPPGVAHFYPAPQPARPIFAAHIQVKPIARPVVPCSIIAVTQTPLYSPPAYGTPSTAYFLQPVSQASAAVPVAVTAHAVPAAASFPAVHYPYMVPVFTG